MYSHMRLKVERCRKRFVTQCTAEVFFTGVGNHMDLICIGTSESLSTFRALIRSVAGMYSRMNSKVALMRKCFLAV
jgi:hypothetical protein